MAKTDLRKAGSHDELIAEATGYAETDDEEILDARDSCSPSAWTSTKTRSTARRTRCARPAACIIIGTERHESRRIDNQLRGRAGRQGDPGETPLLHLA